MTGGSDEEANQLLDTVKRDADPRGLPAIGVIVPSFNQARFLSECLESLFSEGYPELQVVVMDGGSTDGSVGIIRAFEDRLLHWQSQPDGGQASAINEGVAKLGRTDLVAWLNSDDFYLEDALWTVARAYAAHPSAGLYIGNGFRYLDATGRFVPFCRHHVALDREALVRGLDYILQPSVFFSKSAWDEAGGLDGELRYCMDWDLLIRISERQSAVLINEFLAASREYAETKTSSGGLERAFEIDRMIHRHTKEPTTPGSLYYLFESLLALPAETAPQEMRGHVWESMKLLRRGFARDYGNEDAFPVRLDERDSVLLDTPPAASTARSKSDSAAGNLPTISVVVPSFNQARFLGAAVDSLLEQDYPHTDVFVMDGGSTDGSSDVIREREDRLAGWVSEPDGGPADAINKGFARASGEILGWLNSDDLLATGALEAVGRAFAEDPELEMVFGNALYIDEKGAPHIADHGWHRTAFYWGEAQPPDKIPLYWTYVHAVPQPTVYFRRELLERCGGLNADYAFIFDFELFSRFAREAKIAKIEKTMAFYRIHDESKTGGGWRSFQVELYRLSRSQWPSAASRRFYPIWRSFVASYMAERFWGRGKTPKFWCVAALAALSSWTGIGNPESWRVHDAIGAPSAHAPDPAPKGRGYETIVRGRYRKRASAENGDKLYRSVFCSFLWPGHPGRSGGEIRDFHLLRQLLEVSQVDFFAAQPDPIDDRENLLTRVASLHTPWTLDPPGPGRWLRRASLELESLFRSPRWADLARHYHSDVANRLRFLEEHTRRGLERHLRACEADFFFVSPQLNPVALLLERRPPGTKFILATYDVESIRVERLASSQGGLSAGNAESEAAKAARFEKDNLAHFDGIIAVSEMDRESLHRRYGVPEERILVLENGVDTDYFDYRERTATDAPAIVFVSSLGYPPNRDAAWRLVNDILPRVRERVPRARLFLVGQGPQASLLTESDGDRIVVTGAVPDVRPYLAAAAVACIPLSTGSGTKYKVLEALSAGTPVVCTPVAAEGLDLEDETHVLVRESDECIARAIVELLGDEERAGRLARSGRELVERRYSWEAVLPKLNDWLERFQDRS